MSEKLAILGGKPAVTDKIQFRMWPEVTREDEEMILQSLRKGEHAFGPHIQMLQDEFAAWNGNRFCLATNSGTSALHLCVAACGIGPGDEVITSAFSYSSSAACILHHNAIPIFVDCDWEAMHMDPAKIEAAITSKTKGIMVVHLLGVSCDMDPILEVAQRHGLSVIEDACQSHGAPYKGQKTGTLGDVAAFSLNQSKNLSGGEGGLFVTDDEEKFIRGKAVTSFSDMQPSEAMTEQHGYGLGWTYRTSDLDAAFAVSQLRQLERSNKWATENWNLLNDLLEGTPHLIRPYSSEERPTNGFVHVFRTDLEYASERGTPLAALTDGIVAAIQAEGVKMNNRANWLLPAYATFQMKDAYGYGYPWSAEHTRPDISYDLTQYPVAQDCVDTCMWHVYNHRPPNGPEQIEALAAAIRKVYENLDDAPVDV